MVSSTLPYFKAGVLEWRSGGELAGAEKDGVDQCCAELFGRRGNTALPWIRLPSLPLSVFCVFWVFCGERPSGFCGSCALWRPNRNSCALVVRGLSVGAASRSWNPANYTEERPSLSSACRTVSIGMPANFSRVSRSLSPVTIASALAAAAQAST